MPTMSAITIENPGPAAALLFQKIKKPEPGAGEILVKVVAAGDVSVELFGGKTKGDLFERAFDRKLLLSSTLADRFESLPVP